MQTRLLLATLLLAATACSGSDGTKGTDGAKGMNGTDGIVGAKGTDGSNGVDGSNGSNGVDGSNGSNGADGSNGANGIDGVNGTDLILSETARTGLKLSEVPVDLLGLDGDQIESVGRGSYLVNAVADCKGCHGSPDGRFLAGNGEFAIGGFDPANLATNCNVASPPAGCVDGHVFARNLTPDPTTGLKLSEDEFIEALRRGRDWLDATGGTTLVVMPWAQLRWLSTQDLRDIYQYLKHIPAEDNAVQVDVKPVVAPPPSPFYDNNGDPKDLVVFADTDATGVSRALPAAFDPTKMAPTVESGEAFDIGNVLRGLAISPVKDDATVAALSPTEQQLYGRGSYIVNGPALCNECHTAGGRDRATSKVQSAIFLTGGQSFAVPPPLNPVLKQVRTMSANLTGAANGFTLDFAAFTNTWLSGMSFTKSQPHGLGFPMPFDIFRNMSNQDKLAVYTYISTIQKHAAAVGISAGDTAGQAPSRFCDTATEATDCVGTGETCDATSHTCVGGACTTAADCGACQTCSGSNKCVAEDPTSACVKRSL